MNWAWRKLDGGLFHMLVEQQAVSAALLKLVGAI
jgi:hypothetical protein